jgi:hypothetical protein
MFNAFVNPAPIVLMAIGEITDDEIHVLGDVEHVAYLAEAAIDQIAATHREAPFPTGRNNIAGTAARVEALAPEVDCVRQEIDDPTRLGIEAARHVFVTAATGITSVAR